MTTATPNARDRMIEWLREKPEDSTYDGLLRELAFARVIERGLEDSKAGRTISHQEVGRQIDSWAKT